MPTISTQTHKLTFERETCSRCGGSGEYSFNFLDGTRCYGCGGSGVKLTRAGKAAKARFEALIDERLRKPVTEVKVGDVVRSEGFKRVVWRIVTDVRDYPEHGQVSIDCGKIGSTYRVTDTVLVLDEEIMNEIFLQVIKLKGGIATER